MRGLLGWSLLAGALVLSGCYAETEPARAERPAAAAPDAASEQARGSGPSSFDGANSTLGKAKESAKSTIGKLEQHDRDLQKQIDDM